MKYIAVVLAAGSGKRMGRSEKKQYIQLGKYPVLYYSLKALEESEVEEIILVTAEKEIGYCREQIVEKYGFQKITHIISGGTERYHSVYQGLLMIEEEESIVLIQDGARPFLDAAIIKRCIKGAGKYGACAVGMPVKDTIKLVDGKGMVFTTPERSSVWCVQTPQAFYYPVVREAYEKLMEQEIAVTDDAMVVEQFTRHPVKMVEGSYRNIKITTPEDLIIAEGFLEKN